MVDGPVIVRDDVTVSLDRDLINELLGIAEARKITLSVLVREILGSFSRAFRSGTDWTPGSDIVVQPVLPVLPPITGESTEQDHVLRLESRIANHDALLADLQRRILLLESNSAVSYPIISSPSQQGMQTTLPSAPGRLSAVIDCDEPLAGSVSDEALVRARKPVSPVMTSVDINSIGRIIPEQVYSQTEAAALLNVSTSTIRKYVKESRIGSQKIGRSTVFRGQDLLTYLAQTR